jgi:hypothetical protein
MKAVLQQFKLLSLYLIAWTKLEISRKFSVRIVEPMAVYVIITEESLSMKTSSQRRIKSLRGPRPVSSAVPQSTEKCESVC